MPSYDFRCKNCGNEFALFYKTYNDYDTAARLCTVCNSADLSRVIKRVAIQSPTRDYKSMDSGQMLSVLESGDSRQVGEMFSQVAGSSPELGAEFHDTTQRLLGGESMDKVEKHLQEQDAAKKSPAPLSNPPKSPPSDSN
jgi:putative FmdB family regulatory protein